MSHETIMTIWFWTLVVHSAATGGLIACIVRRLIKNEGEDE